MKSTTFLSHRLKALAVFLFITPLCALADGTPYYMTAGEEVDLKWDSQNVVDCRAANNYYTTAWGSSNYTALWSAWAAAPAAFGSYKFNTGVLTTPGSYVFRFNCQDDDSTTRFWEDETVIIHPVAVSVPTLTSSCTGTTCTMSWGAVSGATLYDVQVTKPAGQSCPGGWTTVSTTVCQRSGIAGNNTTYIGVSGTNYPWAVVSRAGSLYSIFTSNGVNTGGPGVYRYTYAQASENLTPTAVASVNVDFTN